MISLARSRLTRLLLEWRAGDQSVLQRLTPWFIGTAPAGAGYMSRERTDHTLQPMALVNEAYVRLVELHGVGWRDRARFLAVAGRTMRRILVVARGWWRWTIGRIGWDSFCGGKAYDNPASPRARPDALTKRVSLSSVE